MCNLAFYIRHLHARGGSSRRINLLQRAKIMHNFLKMEKNYKKNTITYHILTFLTYRIDLNQFGNGHRIKIPTYLTIIPEMNAMTPATIITGR